MISFLVALAVLTAGYFLYGRLAEKVFGPDGRRTPAEAINDGVDCVPMKTWKALLIQLLNIAGTGPIFGALMGACFGPVVFLWIVAGSILGGAVHDYMNGMISERYSGQSVAQLSGVFMGTPVLYVMRVFTVVLLILVGTVFVNSPAALLARLTPDVLSEGFWIVLILLYYLLATLLPIDKIIGRFYPVFGVILLVMAVCVAGAILFLPQYTIPEISLRDLHPEGLPVWPFMFITVACGAVSGFHATQSPMIAKCITSEKAGRSVFYGAMIIEAVIALVWAAAGVAFYGGTQMLGEALDSLGQSGTVYEICRRMLGKVGGVLAVVGVVICPITSGDTAFRSARLTLAEWTGLDQKRIRGRLILTVPMLAVAAVLTLIDFDVIWRYFSLANQALAAVSLWCVTSYLIHRGKYRLGPLMTALPAAFMSAVTLTYLLMAEEGFRMPARIAYPAGFAFAAFLLLVCAVQAYLWHRTPEDVRKAWQGVRRVRGGAGGK